jgi:hypothetical protein
LNGTIGRAESGRKTILNAHGEMGAGIYLQTSYRRLGAKPFSAVTAGLVLTVPAMAGFLIGL